MFERIKEFFKFGSEKGLKFPYAFDGVTGKPSVTLFFSYISFYLAVVSLITLHFNTSLFIASVTAIVFNALMIIFYLIRTIKRAKIDLDDKSLDLEGEGSDNDEVKKNV